VTSGAHRSFASSEWTLRPRTQGRDQSLNKVKKIFGDDAPSPPLIQKHPSSIAPTQDTAWFLKQDLEEDLAYDVKGHVKGGTLDALIERLTSHIMSDSEYTKTFLITFKSFSSQEEFFEKLRGRFDIVPPQGLSSQETEIWNEKVQCITPPNPANLSPCPIQGSQCPEILDERLLHRLTQRQNPAKNQKLGRRAPSRPLRRRKSTCCGPGRSNRRMPLPYE
jgi:son of sevenless